MKFRVTRPPSGGDDLRERVDRLCSWLAGLSESLNVVLSNLGEDNFSDKAKKQLFEGKEEKDGEL